MLLEQKNTYCLEVPAIDNMRQYDGSNLRITVSKMAKGSLPIPEGFVIFATQVCTKTRMPASPLMDTLLCPPGPGGAAA